MKSFVKAIWTGAVVWVVPFVIAFFFYGPRGELAVDIFLFKSVMHVTGSLTGAAMLWVVFGSLREKFLATGLVTGAVWLVLNIGLDGLILLPMSHQTWGEWWPQIGIGYLTMPITASLAGMLLNRQARNVVQDR